MSPPLDERLLREIDGSGLSAGAPVALSLRLILGDQLNGRHHWFDRVEPSVLYVMMEVRQETDYVLHHAQKVLAIFAAMRSFAAGLVAKGHRVQYIRIGDAENRSSMAANLAALLDAHPIRRFEWQAPDEYRLDRILSSFAESLSIETVMVDTEHFYTLRAEVSTHFAGSKWLMETFYRAMRRRHRILVEADGQPMGGAWNFDAENRHAWRGDPPSPTDLRPTHDHQALWDEITAAGVKTFGAPDAGAMRWCVDRSEALVQLDHFVRNALPWFGTYQDAMHSREPVLFHSLLSFALNTKMLDPREVVEAAVRAHGAGQVPIAAAEGFIRQILGWREYMRGVYWAKMPGYTERNALGAQLPLPAWFWDGKTSMRCLRITIEDSLRHAHAHHIQRLMITGNFALIAGIDPQAVHRWYLGIYIDAFEWVEAPNTIGMSQFADGGSLSTKPYAASAAYIHRMSDYCNGCAYHRKERVGANACPFNALYWDFFCTPPGHAREESSPGDRLQEPRKVRTPGAAGDCRACDLSSQQPRRAVTRLEHGRNRVCRFGTNPCLGIAGGSRHMLRWRTWIPWTKISR